MLVFSFGCESSDDNKGGAKYCPLPSCLGLLLDLHIFDDNLTTILDNSQLVSPRVPVSLVMCDGCGGEVMKA